MRLDHFFGGGRRRQVPFGRDDERAVVGDVVIGPDDDLLEALARGARRARDHHRGGDRLGPAIDRARGGPGERTVRGERHAVAGEVDDPCFEAVHPSEAQRGQGPRRCRVLDLQLEIATGWGRFPLSSSRLSSDVSEMCLPGPTPPGSSRSSASGSRAGTWVGSSRSSWWAGSGPVRASPRPRGGRARPWPGCRCHSRRPRAGPAPPSGRTGSTSLPWWRRTRRSGTPGRCLRRTR